MTLDLHTAFTSPHAETELHRLIFLFTVPFFSAYNLRIVDNM